MESSAVSGAVTLREIDAGSVRAICSLAVAEEQRLFVAPNALSIAEAHFSAHAWFRAIHAGDTPVGFVMTEEVPDRAPFLWRFMIDARHQGRGHGRAALALVTARLRAAGARELFTTVVQAPGGPQPFYERLGFVATGEFEEGEAILRLALGSAPE